MESQGQSDPTRQMVDHCPLPLLMDVQRHIKKCPAFALAEAVIASTEEACTVKMAMQRVLNMKTLEDLYLSNGGGFAASLFPHARTSRLAVVMLSGRTEKQDQRKVINC